MSRKPPPCGTPNGWRRHYRRGETPCGPCAQAWRDRNRVMAKQVRARRRRLDTPCRDCGGPRYAGLTANGRCNACRQRHDYTNRTTPGAVARREDFDWLMSTGESLDGAARRVGISLTTAQEWEYQRKQKKAGAR